MAGSTVKWIYKIRWGRRNQESFSGLWLTQWLDRISWWSH
jgi:hypothetical protein